ncbi:hypothetical protein [Kitasatospora sp. NPDC050543]|uniref:hypothetical protein n=1 Tax=Kitasatospora sp. NPDC050543 TaxID=3364054 RepID=UPI00379CCC51
MHTPFRHPLAIHAAGAVLGYRRNGQPIRVIAGGNGAGEGAAGTAPSGAGDGGQGDSGQGAASGQQAATGTPQQSAAAASDTGTATGADHAATIARLAKDLADARREAGAARVNAKQQAADQARADLAQQIGKALGLVKDDTPPDPAALTAQITAQTGRIGELEKDLRAKQVELAVRSAADKQQAKADALLDSRAFSKALADLDPEATDFTTQLDAAIKKAVDTNPNFRSAPQGGRSGADLTGGTGEATKERPKTLGAAISGHYQT